MLKSAFYSSFLIGFLQIIPVSNAQILTNKGETITVSSNAILTVKGSVQNTVNGSQFPVIQNNGTLQLSGDWLNAATTQYSGTGIFELSGSGAQQFSGTNFYVLNISGAGIKTTNGNSSIQNNLSFGPGVTAEINTATNQDTIELGPAATISETATGYVTGWVQTERSLLQNVVYTFGGLGLTFEAKGAAPGLSTVTRGTGPSAIQTNGGNQSIARIFMISPANNAGLNADVTFTYKEGELNSLPEDDLLLFNSFNNGVTWIPAGTATYNATTNTISYSGVNSFAWVTAGSATSPLPVTWLSFTGRAEPEANLLTWATATENNTDAFIIERSEEGTQFAAIGKVKAAGTSNQATAYTFSDKNATVSVAKTTYYRLKQTDTGGRAEYSPIVAITRQAIPFNVTAYPNPFASDLNLEFKNANAGPVTVSFITPDGRTIFSRTLTEGSVNSRLKLPQLPQGLYLLRLEQAGKTTLLKLARQ
jgi:hypothetical protein